MRDLDSVDWGALTHAYGAATDVPNDLRALVSKRQKVREEAMYRLCSNVYHQGSIYPATSSIGSQAGNLQARSA